MYLCLGFILKYPVIYKLAIRYATFIVFIDNIYLV